MKKFFQVFIILGTFVFVSGYSNNNDYNNNDYTECPEDKGTFQGHSAPKRKMQKGYSHPARVDVKGCYDWYVWGTYIFWQPRQDGLELAREVYTPDVPVGEERHTTLVHMDFDYHSGFKVGIGGNFERDDWSMDFEYTRFYTTDNKSKTLSRDLADLDIRRFWPFWNEFDPGAFFHVGAKWRLRFNIIDGILARSYYVGTKLSFKPFVGLRGGWIHQKYHADYSSNYTGTDVFTYLRSRSRSWLIGGRVGLDTNWHLGEGFRFFGNTAASLFYQHFKTRVRNFLPEGQATDSGLLVIREKEGYFNPNFEIAMGFGWGSYFCKDKWHVDLSAGYELHLFWDQNMMRKMFDYMIARSDPTPGDLVLHGLAVSLRFDF
jgi:hypothetical protein